MSSSISVVLATLALAAAPLPLAAAELVMVQERGCIWCARWNDEIAPIFPKTREGRALGLRRIDISERNPEGFAFARPVLFTPTFVLVEDGQELGRIEGYPGEDFFWGLLGQLITENDILMEEEAE